MNKETGDALSELTKSVDSVADRYPDDLFVQALRGQVASVSAAMYASKRSLALADNGYPINPNGAMTHGHLQKYADAYKGKRWRDALTFVAWHLPTRPEALSTVLQAAIDSTVLQRAPGIGPVIFDRIVAVFELEGEYDYNNCVESIGRTQRFMQEYL